MEQVQKFIWNINWTNLWQFVCCWFKMTGRNTRNFGAPHTTQPWTFGQEDQRIILSIWMLIEPSHTSKAGLVVLSFCYACVLAHSPRWSTGIRVASGFEFSVEFAASVNLKTHNTSTRTVINVLRNLRPEWSWRGMILQPEL